MIYAYKHGDHIIHYLLSTYVVIEVIIAEYCKKYYSHFLNLY